MADTKAKKREDEAAFEEKFKEFDFVRFTMSDINGMGRTKLMTARYAHKFGGGTGCFSGLICGGPLSEEYCPEIIMKANFPNALMKPDIKSVHPVPWASNEEFKVGQVLCETTWNDGRPQEAHPRYMARKLVDTLEQEFGLEIMSAFEMEFMLLDTVTRTPVFPTLDYMVTVTTGEMESFFMPFEKNIRDTGVRIECLHCEHAPGQCEAVLVPAYGVRAADDCFLVKLGLKELALKRGLQANFMAKPDPQQAGNGTHFNFSLWNKASGASAMFDASHDTKLSDTARWWLGGIIHHFRAISALCAPTVNCYRRFHRPWAPDVADWGIDDRTVAVRVKVGSPSSTYMENRIPSGLSNPYVVLAATLAAGINGLRHKMEPPAPGPEGAAKIPNNLEESLAALEEDKDLCNILGQEFVDWFIGNKREIDLKILKDSDPTVDDAKALEKEFTEYSKFM